MFNRFVSPRYARTIATAIEDATSTRSLTSVRVTGSSARLSTIRALSIRQHNLESPISFHTPQQRSFSASHDDFAPQKKHNLENEDDSSILKMIESHVQSNKIMLYMKGNPSQPMCGFSATVVQILKNQGVDFASVNVLDYPEVREGVKKYSQWPTIPQLYVDGEFIGGCDIVRDMHESGELSSLLKGEEGDKEKNE
eukprot:CAMPEP_0171360882 /NCGR_PEP_ID=MMETSP0879-20121228/1569_1 /TAXON_ID=67004 /ORGANISM="Thalassiosira weissflogii, Strain CCMP1336" /LENGTH=196 /DNA_ID=CAMNT_0011867379 /DNA_START=31 /DNA_END=621 /DNA_ORIENTATION=-